MISSKEDRWDGSQCSTEPVSLVQQLHVVPNPWENPKHHLGPWLWGSGGAAMKEDCLVQTQESGGSGYRLLKSSELRNCTLLCMENGGWDLWLPTEVASRSFLRCPWLPLDGGPHLSTSFKTVRIASSCLPVLFLPLVLSRLLSKSSSCLWPHYFA